MGKRNSIVILLNNDITINNISLIDNYNARKEIQVSHKSRFTKYAKKAIAATSSFQLSQGIHELAKSHTKANK